MALFGAADKLNLPPLTVPRTGVNRIIPLPEKAGLAKCRYLGNHSTELFFLEAAMPYE